VLDPAAASLIGVAVGGVLALLVEERKDSFQRRRERQREERELKQPLRVIEDELFNSRIAIDVTLQDRAWWSEYYTLSTDGWEKFGTVVAGSDIDDADWETVSDAASEGRAVLRLRATRDGGPPALTDYPTLVGAADSMTRATNALRTSRGLSEIEGFPAPKWYRDRHAAWQTASRAARDEGRPVPPFEDFLTDD
jgi:hypothetical protein